MDCQAVDRWLDEGVAEAGRAAALAHARGCPRCARSLAAAAELDALLAPTPTAMPRGFTDRVMARVAATPQVRARVPVAELLPFLPTLPWWVRAALEPASILAALLASVLVWQGNALFALATRGTVLVMAWLSQNLGTAVAPAPVGPLDSPWFQPLALTAAVLGAAPLVLLSSRLLYRWSAAMVGPRPGHLRPR